MSTIPDPYRELVDDAAIFPPGDAALTEAVPAHREHLRAAYSDLLGGFVISDVRLPELIEIIGRSGGEPVAVNVVVTGGAGAIEPAVRWATGSGRLELRSVEIALRDEDDLAYNARRVTTAVDQLAVAGQLTEETTVYVEPPRLFDQPPTRSWLSALDEIAAMDLCVKFRTGGVTEDAFPSTDELAASIEATLDRELRFKCTAGLHNALRHREAETGFEHHGFLNVLLATRAGLDGASLADVMAVLAETDAGVVTKELAAVGEAGLVSARRWFTSFGSCSVLEPLDDLVSLGLASAG